MPFNLHPFAILRASDRYVLRFQADDTTAEGEIALPVVADPDPELGPDERLWGPDFEVLEDRVRAYGRAVPLEPEELLQARLKRLDDLIATLSAKA